MTDRFFTDSWVRRLSDLAVDLDLAQPDDRAIYRERVRRATRFVKVAALQQVIRDGFGLMGNHPTRDGATRTLAGAVIRGTLGSMPDRPADGRNDGR